MRLPKSPDPDPTPGADAATSRRNLATLSVASLLTDLSSEMVLNLVPLYLWGVLGVGAPVIGLVEGMAETTASLLRWFSGWLSDRWGSRKWLAVAGYGLSALAKPFFYAATVWGEVAAVRWVERAGKGLRTAPRDALLAAGSAPARRGFAFGLHRAADTLGAAAGLAVALWVVGGLDGGGALTRESFERVVLWSLLPAFLAVAVIALGARDVPRGRSQPVLVAVPARGPRAPGRRFGVFLAIVAVFELGNSAGAFLVLRAAERGVSVAGVLAMLLVFNVVYALASWPSGVLSDHLGRRRLLVAGWVLYALVYLGFGRAETGWQIGALFALYGLYHGLTQGAIRAFVADLVAEERRGTAYGWLNAVLGGLQLPASLLAGLLWHAFGPQAPFLAGAVLAVLAALLMVGPGRMLEPARPRRVSC